MIELNEKDADWLANIARKELKELEKEENTLNKQTFAANTLLEMLKNSGDADYERLKAKGDKLELEVRKQLNDRKNQWFRILELMMSGSEK